MHWILTGMLVVASLATAVYTGYLMRRLFTLEPGAADAAGAGVQAAPAAPQPEPDRTEPATAPPAAAQEKA